MNLIRRHGKGARPQKTDEGEVCLQPGAERDRTTAGTHPALIEFVRLLAREAAREFLAGSHSQLGKGDPS